MPDSAKSDFEFTEDLFAEYYNKREQSRTKRSGALVTLVGVLFVILAIQYVAREGRSLLVLVFGLLALALIGIGVYQMITGATLINPQSRRWTKIILPYFNRHLADTTEPRPWSYHTSTATTHEGITVSFEPAKQGRFATKPLSFTKPYAEFEQVVETPRLIIALGKRSPNSSNSDQVEDAIFLKEGLTGMTAEALLAHLEHSIATSKPIDSSDVSSSSNDVQHGSNVTLLNKPAA